MGQDREPMLYYKSSQKNSSFRTYPINICCYYFIYKEKEHITQLSAYNRII